jgi:sugar O-acyltransferase (sialic acid O-acetyltransferase NeuD family)
MMDQAGMRAHEVILLGGGGHAAVVTEAAVAAGWSVLGFGDDQRSTTTPDGLEYLGSIDEALRCAHARAAAVHCAVGDAHLRKTWAEAAGTLFLARIVHPHAFLSPSTDVEPGVFISAGAVINARARLGRCAIINTSAVIEHDCTVGPFAHVAPHAVLTGRVSVGAAALIGAGAIIVPGRTIGERATVGAGAVVLEDVPAGSTVVGVPARALVPATA